VSRLSRQCEILNISQHYKSPRPVTGDSFTLQLCAVLTVCNVSFIACVALFAVLFERGVVFCLSCLIVVPLLPGKNTSAVQSDNNNNNNNNNILAGINPREAIHVRSSTVASWGLY
jgi:hypothetical protein